MKDNWNILEQLRDIVDKSGLRSKPAVRIEGPSITEMSGDIESRCWIWANDKLFPIEQLLVHNGIDRCTAAEAVADFRDQINEIVNQLKDR